MSPIAEQLSESRQSSWVIDGVVLYHIRCLKYITNTKSSGSMSAFGGKADIVRIGDLCPLMTQSGH